MSTPRATLSPTCKQESPLPVTFPASTDSSDAEGVTSDHSHAMEEENRDPHSGTGGIDGLPSKRSEPPSGNVAQRQMRRFAKSADKRQSVHMLGSIEHLKHHFLKFGLAAQETPNIRGAPQPALGLSLRDAPPGINASDGGSNHIPSPIPPATVQRSPYPIIEDTRIDLESLRDQALRSLRAVDEIWHIHPSPVSVNDNHELSKEIDILETLKISVEAIRAVRGYSLALPTSSLLSSSKMPSTSMLRVPSGLGRVRQPLSTPSRPAPRSVSSSGSGSSIHRNPSPAIDEDPLAEVRRAALDVLIGLRAVEERSRIEGSNDGKGTSECYLGETVDPAKSGCGSLLHAHASVQGSADLGNQESPQLMVNLTTEEQEDDDDDLSFFFPNDSEEQGSALKDSWYKRLYDADREGWLYRTDLRIDEDFGEEQQLVKAWMTAVDRRIFGGEGNVNHPAWITATLSRADDLIEHGVPRGALGLDNLDWLDPKVTQDTLARCRSFLEKFLPHELSSRLSPMQQIGVNGGLLNLLADGYLCVIAFNACLQHSASPWGQISLEEVHDTFGTNASSADAVYLKRDWTFRRAENLRLLGAALKHRYRIPLNFPYQIIPLKPAGIPPPLDNKSRSHRVPPIASSPAAPHSSRVALDGIYFDPVALARRDAGWEETLQCVVDAWLRSVYKEFIDQQQKTLDRVTPVHPVL